MFMPEEITKPVDYGKPEEFDKPEDYASSSAAHTPLAISTEHMPFVPSSSLASTAPHTHAHKKRVSDAQAFSLQCISWSEHSLIVTLFSREYGLIAGVAKSAKRPYSVLRPISAHFQPLRVSWSGTGEIKTITRVETDGFINMPSENLMSAWYLNELILRGIAKEDPHERLYDYYVQALNDLAAHVDARTVLRRFEWQWLCETGYGFDTPEPDFSDLEKEPELRKQLRLKIANVLNRTSLNVRENQNHLSRLITTRSKTEDTQ